MDQSQEQLHSTINNIYTTGTTGDQFVVFIIKLFFILLPLLYLFLSRKKRDLNKNLIKGLEPIPKQKIIIALEIKDFFVNLSNKLENGFEEIQLEQKTQNLIMKTFSNLLGSTLYYKALFPAKQIQHFLKGLKAVKDVEVMIYTYLSPVVAEFLLKRLKLTDYFQPKQIKYCNLAKEDMLKHAIDIDKDTRRVIIVTPSKKDHSNQHENYFLVLNPKRSKNSNYLKQHLKFLKDLLQANTNRDTLHDQLYQLKIDIQQSDYSDVQRNHQN